MTYSRVQIFSNDGSYLTETRARCKRAWLMDDNGDGTLYMPKNDINATEANLRYGNFVYVRNKLVGDWVGVIRTPLSFGNSTYEIGLQQAGVLLKDRPVRKVDKGTSDAIVRQLISDANEEADLRIRPGEFTATSAVTSLPSIMDSALVAVKKLVERTGSHWSVDPVVGADGRLFIQFNWLTTVGQSFIGTIELHEGQGANIERDERDPVVQQGEIYNHVTVVGKSATNDRLQPGIAFDQDSINLYGLRKCILTENLSTQTSVNNSATYHVSVMAWPQYTLNLTAITAAIYPYIQIGNYLSVRLISVGFSNGQPGFRGSAQVVGKAYDDTEGSMPLTLVALR